MSMRWKEAGRLLFLCKMCLFCSVLAISCRFLFFLSSGIFPEKHKERGKNMTTSNKDEMLTKISLLAQAVGNMDEDTDDMLDIISSDLRSACNYVESVYNMEYSIPIVRMRYEGQDMIDHIEALDSGRRHAHERAMMGVKRLNRFSRMFNLPDFYVGDENDRNAVGDFCMVLVKELFDGRMSAVDISALCSEVAKGGEE